jgi:hypothetical protein
MNVVKWFAVKPNEYWNQFFNSFTVNGVVQKKMNDEATNIVGSWQSMGGNALTKYILLPMAGRLSGHTTTSGFQGI